MIRTTNIIKYLAYNILKLKGFVMRNFRPSYSNRRRFNPPMSTCHTIRDVGPQPFITNITELTKKNDNFRTTLWTGTHLQVTLMSLNVGEDIGIEMHPDLDQFIRIEQGDACVMMGRFKDRLDIQQNICADYAFIVPAGTWHNLMNTGCIPLKLYSIYAPPQHPHGAIHVTKCDAIDSEHH